MSSPARVLATPEQRLETIRELRMAIASLEMVNAHTQQAAFRSVSVPSLSDSLRARVHEELDRIRDCEIALLELEMAEADDCIIVDGHVVVDRSHRGEDKAQIKVEEVKLESASSSFDKYIAGDPRDEAAEKERSAKKGSAAQ